MKHDKMCRSTNVDPKGCHCVAYKAVRKDEREEAEKRIRKSGIARWLPPHVWDDLMKSVREEDK